MAEYILARHISLQTGEVINPYLLLENGKIKTFAFNPRDMAEGIYTEFFEFHSIADNTNTISYLEEEKLLFSYIKKSSLTKKRHLFKSQKLIPLSKEDRKSLEQALAEFNT